MTFVLVWLIYAWVLSGVLGRRGFRCPATRTGHQPAAAGEGATSQEGAVSRAGGVNAVGGSSARILLIGATGGTGRQLLAQALERGYSVTALVRNPATLRIDHPALRVLRGDVLDFASIESAMQGQQAVISALGHRKFFQPTRILSEGTANVLRAMKAHGVERFICETSLGIGDSAYRMGLYYTLFVIPFILPFYFWDKTRQEQLVATSDADWVIVRPGALTNGPRKGYRHGLHIGGWLATPRISRADTADFMLNQVCDDAYSRASPGVCS